MPEADIVQSSTRSVRMALRNDEFSGDRLAFRQNSQQPAPVLIGSGNHFHVGQTIRHQIERPG